MSIPTRVSRWLTAPILCALVAGALHAGDTDAPVRITLRPAGVDAVADAGLLDRLNAWLDAHVDWPAPDRAPAIRYVTPRQAARMAGAPALGHGRHRGLYDAATGTIHLVTPWSADEPGDVSVLLHELVHHRQADHHFYCAAAQEPAAYRAQEAWLAERGLTLEVNWLAITWAAGCTRRDIHPD
ncbi:hypothetical protein OB2597_04680 [Pseudooceanicola batsensis HTCC2597]|uniref:DUF6647 domain-containing protein n=1 Tax=Pseudooceanicola batsensis (strain ATCC BAA-863 / DSM 15984 / KCTC 12145 / HTCC2597) TaxID=252305 RepID=A3TSC1_PSEBH|nr:DUF6647 family protein [Pseudooceanicola batsensis]EAQ04548.1 hypothetical protein OB2597_04680 [Pseudooceanicola batsensis HTCC2597]